MRLKRELQTALDAKDLCELALARHQKVGVEGPTSSGDGIQGETELTRLKRDLMLAEVGCD